MQIEAELGFFLLTFVAITSTCAAVLHWFRRLTAREVMLAHQIAASHLISLASVCGLLLLIACFVQDNFALEYVAAHSNTELPLAFKVAAAWGGHQGSMLFWVVILSLWASFISFKVPLNQQYTGDCLGIMNVLIMVFACFTLATSNPFDYASVFAEQGRDLNPMLQDIGLIIHPPLLYLGYVGFAAILAFALAALIHKDAINQWYSMARGAVFFAWGSLTLGIVIGAWWAYNELGWGGWWFWDPVENASLLPWLTASALLHSGVLAKRNQQTLWSTFALAFATFSLSVLGTFVVRSGVLTSVHAFAVDPTKGIALLVVLSILVLVTFGALIMRSEQIKTIKFASLISQSYLTYMAIGLFVITTAIVFLGTFYPMLYQLLGLGSISVGAPYFNTLVFPLAIIALVLLAIAPLLQWQKGRTKSAMTQASIALVITAIGALCFVFGQDNIQLPSFLTLFLALWVISIHSLAFIVSTRKRAQLPMLLAHIGFAVATTGAVFNADYSYEHNLRVEPNQRYSYANMWVDYRGIAWDIGANYTVERAHIRLQPKNGDAFSLYPERRHYAVRVMNMTEPAIYSTWHGDHYATLGDKVAANAYALKVQYRAGIVWIWLGGLLMVLGALCAFIPSRRFAVISSQNSLAATAK